MFEVNGTSLVVFGSFVVYMTVMNKLFFAPMFHVTQARQALIDEAIVRAQKASDVLPMVVGKPPTAGSARRPV